MRITLMGLQIKQAAYVVDDCTKASKYIVFRVQDILAPWERIGNK